MEDLLFFLVSVVGTTTLQRGTTTAVAAVLETMGIHLCQDKVFRPKDGADEAGLFLEQRGRRPRSCRAACTMTAAAQEPWNSNATPVFRVGKEKSWSRVRDDGGSGETLFHYHTFSNQTTIMTIYFVTICNQIKYVISNPTLKPTVT